MTELEPWAELCERLAGTTKKLEKRAWMAEYLRELPVEDAALAALYLAGTPFPETDLRQLSVGGASLSRVVQELAKATDAALHAAYRRHGDLGSAAFDLLAAREEAVTARLTLRDVAELFEQLAEARGVAPRQTLLMGLLGRATPLEAKYLIKLMSGDMRIGVKQAQVEEAIAVAAERELSAVRRAVMLLGDLAEVVRLADADRLNAAEMRLFHPLGFMLASPVDSVEEAMARFTEEVTAEAAAAADAHPTSLQDGGRLDTAEKKAYLRSAERLDDSAAELELAHNSSSRLGETDKGGASNRLQMLRSAQEDALVGEAHVQPALTLAHIQDKFDGIRCQLHCGDLAQPGRVALFSRTRDDMTHSFPELSEAFATITEPLILDGEILAWRVGEGSARNDEKGVSRSDSDARNQAERALPFSSLQNRIGRKRVTAEMRRETPVIFMAFDLLSRGGALLLEQPLAARRTQLEAVCAMYAPRTVVSSTPSSKLELAAAQGMLFAPSAEVPVSAAEDAFARLVLAPIAELTGADQLEQAYADARARGNEGVMLKAAGSLYQPGRRGSAWLKLKRELATLDVVVTSAEYGHGKRAGTLSDYTFAVRDGDALKNVGKAYSGLTDAEIAFLSEHFHEHTIEDFGGWRTVEPTIVLEVAFNNLMRSDRHASGFSMRFPRIIRIRDDKPAEEIDTLARVEELYNAQPDKPVEGRTD